MVPKDPDVKLSETIPALVLKLLFWFQRTVVDGCWDAAVEAPVATVESAIADVASSKRFLIAYPLCAPPFISPFLPVRAMSHFSCPSNRRPCRRYFQKNNSQ